MPISRCHLIKKKSIISKSYSGVAGLSFCFINEFLDELNEILTFSIFCLDRYCYLFHSRISFKKYLDFFLRSVSSSLLLVAFSLMNYMIKVFMYFSGLTALRDSIYRLASSG